MINSRILNKLTQDKKKIILVIAVAAIFLYLDFTLLIGSQLKGIKNISPKIIKLKTDLNNFSKDLVKIQDLKDKQPGRKIDASFRPKKFITDAEIPSLLKTISEIANKNTVKIIQIKPAKELKPSPDKTASLPAASSSLLIALDLICDYHHFGKFLNELEDAGIFLAVEEMKISSQSLDYFQQKVNLVLKTYVKK